MRAGADRCNLAGSAGQMMQALYSSSSELFRLDQVDATVLRGSWYEIDLGAVRHNFRQLRGVLPSPVRIYPCLKRNGYGCGAAPMAVTLEAEGADGFAVASLLDAVSIRRLGVISPILLYAGAQPSAGSVIKALDLTVSVSSVDELEQWRRAVSPLNVFIKVDLGFFRAGVTPQMAGELLSAAASCPGVQVKGLYAHMSELPQAESVGVTDQLLRMRSILAAAEANGVRPELVMMSSTEGVLSHPDLDFDVVDPGALFVGLPETSLPVRDVSLRPVLKAIRTRLVAVKEIDASLGPIPEISGFYEGMRLGVIGFGWGDGYPRNVPRDAQAIVGGKRVPILPPAHLEHLRIDLSSVPDARFGDPVILLGQQDDAVISHEEIASQWGTDIIGLYGHLRDHIPRIYI